jgi:hypothetical protein
VLLRQRIVASMRVLRTIIAVLVSLGALIFCAWLATVVRVGHWGFSISVTFLFMALFTFILGALFQPAYVSAYFTPRPFERNGAIYRWFGIRLYASALRVIGWEKIIRKDQAITLDVESLQGFEHWTRGAETVHTLAAIVVAGMTVWVGAVHSLGETKWLVLSNLLFNVYPVMLQRYNRARVTRLLRRAER